MKKVICLFIGLFMVFAVCGCASGKESSSSSDAVSSEVSSAVISDDNLSKWKVSLTTVLPTLVPPKKIWVYSFC